MQIVIDIDENVFTRLFDNGKEDYEIVNDDLFAIAKSIRNGTQLPKGHGRLIILSEDAVKREQTRFSFSWQNWISEIGLSNATVAIIKADKAESER